jgi:hypothetical protein
MFLVTLCGASCILFLATAADVVEKRRAAEFSVRPSAKQRCCEHGRGGVGQIDIGVGEHPQLLTMTYNDCDIYIPPFVDSPR